MNAKRLIILILLCCATTSCARKHPAPLRSANLRRLTRRQYNQRRAIAINETVSAEESSNKNQYNNYVIVQKNDTAYSIARKHKIPLRSLIEINNLKEPYNLKTGQKLAISNTKYYTVKKNDTLYSIARSHSVTLSSLISVNNLRSPYIISKGDKLTIPYNSKSTTRKSLVKNNTQVKTNKNIISKTPPKRSSSKFLKPTSGKIVSSFGSKKNGLHNDGINILAPKGTAVKAAENGIVVYASDKIKGLGNIILIKHDSGWITTYAHLNKILVEKGQTVNRGSIIGTVGNTGSVDTHQLHFEIRKRTKPVNPEKYI